MWHLLERLLMILVTHFSLLCVKLRLQIRILHITLLQLLAVVLQESFLLLQDICNLLVKCFYLCVLLRANPLFLLSHVLSIQTILLDFLFGNFFPFLQKLNVIFLSLLLNQLVIFVHFTHKSHVSVVHLFHVFFDFDDVLFGELNGHKVWASALSSWRCHILVIKHRTETLVSRHFSNLIVGISVRVVVPLQLIAIWAFVVIAKGAILIAIVTIRVEGTSIFRVLLLSVSVIQLAMWGPLLLLSLTFRLSVLFHLSLFSPLPRVIRLRVRMRVVAGLIDDVRYVSNRVHLLHFVDVDGVHSHGWGTFARWCFAPFHGYFWRNIGWTWVLTVSCSNSNLRLILFIWASYWRYLTCADISFWLLTLDS